MDYQLTRIDVAFGAQRLALSVLASFDAAVNELCDTLPPGISDADLLAQCPFFGKIWPSARVVAATLARMGRGGLEGRDVLELGCGLGLPSLLAARFGARVVATDFHPDVPEFLARNLALNGLEGAVDYRRVDWQDGLTDLGGFDWVVASDVLYGPAHPELLARTLDDHLAPGGRALLADPGRAYLQAFLGRMSARGFACELECVDDIYLLHVTRRRS